MAACCQNLPLGALSSRSAPSMLVGTLFKKVRSFFEHAEIQENAIRELRVITESAFQEDSNNGRNVGNGVSPVEGTTLKGTVLKILQNKVFIAKVRSFLNTPCIRIICKSVANKYFIRVSLKR
jgi:hypothetical protein